MKSYCSLQIWVLSYVSLTEEVWFHQANMTVTTHATVSFSFSFVFTRDLYNTHYITYFMAHSFYAYLAPPIAVGVLLTCQNLDPEYKMTAFFQMYLQEKNIVLYSGQYCSLFILSARTFFALNSRAHYSRMDSDWVSMSYHSSAGKKNHSESDSNDIVSLCLYRYSYGVDSAIL